jgi:hypothetical protein
LAMNFAGRIQLMRYESQLAESNYIMNGYCLYFNS